MSYVAFSLFYNAGTLVCDTINNILLYQPDGALLLYDPEASQYITTNKLFCHNFLCYNMCYRKFRK